MELIFASSMAWRIFSHFLENGGQARYVKELSRALGISAGTASQVCRRLLKENLLSAKRTGNLLQYSANEENVLVRRLKTDLFLSKLLRHETDWSGEEVQAVALYGSYASGEYSEKSDVDILVLTNIEERKARGMFRCLGSSPKQELSLTIMPLSKWRELARKKDRFYIEVLANHILLAGKSLVMD